MKATGVRALAMVLAVGVVAESPMARPGAQQPPAGIRRIDLQRRDLGVAGREVVQVRVEIDPGVEFGRHSHPGEEVVYVLEGSLQYALDGAAPETLEAGGVLFIPAGTIHSAKNVGNSTAAELATYIVEKGKSLVVMATNTTGARIGADRPPWGRVAQPSSTGSALPPIDSTRLGRSGHMVTNAGSE